MSLQGEKNSDKVQEPPAPQDPHISLQHHSFQLLQIIHTPPRHTRSHYLSMRTKGSVSFTPSHSEVSETGLGTRKNTPGVLLPAVDVHTAACLEGRAQGRLVGGLQTVDSADEDTCLPTTNPIHSETESQLHLTEQPSHQASSQPLLWANLSISSPENNQKCLCLEERSPAPPPAQL